ncbi:PEP-CTERM sorting domain-containing protein [Glacieibacterium frigidum]|uniref:PEP-CTERM sorting domain-containing protein n=2 Tax=Glacieibacterium frigidum TaxID=2593303 RepID=A0A552UJG3_9SPHN|nr:PEP-CTERM sorting domain-containing protein [Glacieibacterium frigidum]
MTTAIGGLNSTGAEIVLRVSDTDDYHNGSLFGQTFAGRQRWADYATVTTDPTSFHTFWVSGTFAREYNNAAGGHPGGTGGSRWGTYIAAINVGGVPEPTTWAMLIIGFGLVGAQARRSRSGYATA